MKKFELKSFISEIYKNDFVKKCGIPLGYKAAFPIIKVKNGNVLLTVPFNKVQKSKTPGVSAVLPIAYTVTFKLYAVKSIPESFKKTTGADTGYSNAKPVAFENLAFSDSFAGVSFAKPVEPFPNQEMKEMGSEEYKEKIEKLYKAYDAVINDLLGIENAPGIEKLECKQLLNALVGPATKQLYARLDKKFYDEYLTAK